MTLFMRQSMSKPRELTFRLPTPNNHIINFKTWFYDDFTSMFLSDKWPGLVIGKWILNRETQSLDCVVVIQVHHLL